MALRRTRVGGKPRKNLGARLARVKQRLGKTYAELGAELHIHPITIHKYCVGKSAPRNGLLRLMVEKYLRKYHG